MAERPRSGLYVLFPKLHVYEMTDCLGSCLVILLLMFSGVAPILLYRSARCVILLDVPTESQEAEAAKTGKRTGHLHIPSSLSKEYVRCVLVHRCLFCQLALCVFMSSVWI